MKLPRFYRYIIYRFYSWRLSKKDDTPIMNIVFTMTIIHLLQLMLLILLLIQFFPSFATAFSLKKEYVFAIIVVGFLFYYLLIYDKTRWKNYLEEFKNENETERKKGTMLFRVFTIGTVLVFFIVLYLHILI